MKHLLALSLVLFGSATAVGDAPVLRTVAEARAVLRDRQSALRTFDISGQAISDSDFSLFYLQDKTGGALCLLPSGPASQVRRGELLHIRGTVNQLRRHRLELLIDRFERLGANPPPPPIDASPMQLADEDLQCRLVTIRGSVFRVEADDIDSHYRWLVLSTPYGPVRVACLDRFYRQDDLHRLVDADVTVDGIVAPFLGVRRPLGNYVSIVASDGIRVLTKPPSDPFDVPEMDGRPSLHRQRIKGVVLAVTRNEFYMATAIHTLLPVKPLVSAVLPTPGERALAAGYSAPVPSFPRMVDAVWRPTEGPHWRLAPKKIAMRDLFVTTNGEHQLNMPCHGTIVRLTGTIDYRPDEFRERSVLTLINGPHAIRVDVSRAWPDADKAIAAGSVVEVAGLCVMEFEHDSLSAATFPRFERVTLIPRDPDDFNILEAPPWWTPFRLFCIIAALLALIAAILVWNILLRRLSERHGRQLAREQLQRAKSELKVEERTRLAVELHDSISQTLTGVALQIDAAQGSAGNPPVSGRFLDTARAMLASCRQELRCCIWDLKSRTFDERDMTEAVTRTLAPHLGDTKARVRFNVPRSILSESAAHDVLRIVRELAVNAIRHGGATRLRIAGELDGGTIRFSVRDDGCGFDPSAVPGPSAGHFGLQGIRERLHNRNGTVRIDSAPGAGTKVTVSFDADEKDEDEE